jgi:hypothetical protein
VVDESWVVVAEHVMPVAWVPLDGGCLELIFFETLLRDDGIDVVFDPFRPGEGGGFTRDCAQPVRLLVRASDSGRARALVDEARREVR